jgi:cytochrome c-type biogenesis protein CcmH
MMLWFALALMTAAAIFAVLWPLARRTSQLRSGSDVAVYRDQLEEIERDRAAGLIEEPEAAGAQVEVSRRLIAAVDAQAAPSSAATVAAMTLATAWRRRVVAVVALVALPIGAAGFYLLIGSPLLPDQPLAPRLAQAPNTQSIDDVIARVESHLEQNPNDGRGWEVIAPIYTRLGRFDDALKARRNSLRLNGETAQRSAALGEALVLAANGVVTAEARAAFERAVALDGSDVQARYFLGLAAEQAGNPAQAAEVWRALIAAAPPDAPWRDFIQRALDRLGSTAAPAAPSGPTKEQIAASSDLSPDQRTTMVRGMVARLAERLQNDGSDVEGWMRLVRSYMVLGERDKARAAVADARRALADDAAKLQRLDELIKELKLEG